VALDVVGRGDGQRARRGRQPVLAAARSFVCVEERDERGGGSRACRRKIGLAAKLGKGFAGKLKKHEKCIRKKKFGTKA
jgi:hypothetical protein